MRFFAILALTTALPAQDSPLLQQETGRARQLLDSSGWADKAWGAYTAGRLHSDELRESLVAAFRPAAASRSAPPGTEQHAYLAALFDAAIQAEIQIPSQLLEPFEEAWSDPVMILLARTADRETSWV